MTNPDPLAVVDGVGTLDVKSPETFASKITGVGSMVETSRELMRVGKTKLMVPDVGSMPR